MDGNSKRAYIKQVIRQLNLENPGMKQQLFSALVHSEIDGWK